MKNILFITWDGPQTTYMEGLFMPIFAAVQKERPDYVFHVLQFTWAEEERLAKTKAAAEAYKIRYTAHPIWRRPHIHLGTAWTIYRGIQFLRAYIEREQIDLVMPRSTLPAMLVNRLRLNKLKILFDADGLPIEERVDFAGLLAGSWLYRLLKSEERKILLSADAIITRSQKAIDYHLQQIGASHAAKFSVVYNGRDSSLFKPNEIDRTATRSALGIGENDKVFVYCGSLGPQYGWQEMLAIFEQYRATAPRAKFLVLTGSPDYVAKHTTAAIQAHLIVKKVPFVEVPTYLNAADVAFAIRDPKPSMIGVAPIKLGEYLLMGLPTIASRGIGDSETMLEGLSGTLLLDASIQEKMASILEFLTATSSFDRATIRARGLAYSSLESACASYILALDRLE